MRLRCSRGGCAFDFRHISLLAEHSQHTLGTVWHKEIFSIRRGQSDSPEVLEALIFNRFSGWCMGWEGGFAYVGCRVSLRASRLAVSSHLSSLHSASCFGLCELLGLDIAHELASFLDSHHSLIGIDQCIWTADNHVS
jgi:hypothetical protein